MKTEDFNNYRRLPPRQIEHDCNLPASFDLARPFFLLELARLTGSSSLNMTDGTPLGHDPAARRDLTWGRTGRDPTGSGMTCGF